MLLIIDENVIAILILYFTKLGQVAGRLYLRRNKRSLFLTHDFILIDHALLKQINEYWRNR